VSSLEEPAKWWDEKCASCHADPSAKTCTEDAKVRATKNDHCIACHMRKGPPVRPDLVTVTDHWIQRRPPPVKSGEEIPKAIKAWSSFFGEHDEGADLSAVEVVALDESGLTDDAVAREIAATAGFPHVPRFYAFLAEQCARPGGAPTCAHVNATVLRFAPDDADALLGFARAMLDFGSPAALGEARHALDRLVAIDPDTQIPLETLGVFSFRTGDVEAARDDFTRATSYPFAAASHVGLAVLALRAGKNADAAAELEAARLVEPRDGWIGDRLEKLYVSIGDAKHADDLARILKWFDAHGGRRLTPASAWLPPDWR
jgi:Flp pilus assembly protein TadD